MTMRIKKRSDILIDREKVMQLSRKFGLPEKFVELLLLRGLSTETDIDNFLYPKSENLYDPFLMKDMRVVADRLNKAIERKEKVVIYGDYDADGICAASILSLYLASRGLDVYTHIPNRVEDGYGLNNDAIERIIEGCCPDIILTCDCGISGYDEVEYALDLGVEMLVTDHHEVPERVPQCPVVNPHQRDCEYPFEHLCGAGVALKLVQALGGVDEAMQYIDLAAIATIADLVPLVGENRVIVQIGLKRLAERRNIGLRMLFDSLKLPTELTSGDIAFKVAPRINAAGRMGDAYRAFEMITECDVAKLKQIIAEINDDNDRRKDACDKLFAEACADLQWEKLYDRRAIVLSHPSWEKGITGIAAAKLAGDFHRPSFILVKSGDVFKGTARSVEGVNVHELLNEVSPYLEEFGGHSQAAGFSIREENIPVFKAAVEEYLKRFDDSYFLPSLTYDLEILPEEIDMEFVRALSLLEPTGNGNGKPLFLMRASGVYTEPCKSNPVHISVRAGSLNIIAFNFAKKNQILAGKGEKKLVFELQTDTYQTESFKGILRDAASDELFIDDEVAQAYFIKLANVKTAAPAKYTLYDDVGEISCGMYGTMYIAGRKRTYDEFIAKHSDKIILKEFMNPTTANNYSRIIVSPEFDADLPLDLYEKIVFLDSPPDEHIVAYINKKTKAEVFLPKNDNFPLFMSDIVFAREEFGKYFEAIRKHSFAATGLMNYFTQLSKRAHGLNFKQFIVCLSVFLDLGLVSVSRSGGFKLVVASGAKTALTASDLYNRWAGYKK